MKTQTKEQAQDAVPERKDYTYILRRYEAAKAKRSNWESHWRDAYNYALPQRNGFDGTGATGQPKHDQLYDATAMDAAEQLASSLLGNITPPWSQWFGLKPGPDMGRREAQLLAPALEQAGRTIQNHFDRSNFIVEMHQCYLDLVVGGTAVLAFEEAAPGQLSAFRFTAVPLSCVTLEEGEDGILNGFYRTLSLTLEQLRDRYPLAELPNAVLMAGEKDTQRKFEILESVIPNALGTFDSTALLMEGGKPVLLRESRLPQSPLIAFRWLKSPGEIYGRSPVMKALPDIKTANKVVELILKNASIAVTGIWQADDDGVLNPSNIDLTPGTIIPKAVGSKGLSPLEMPGRFDISQIVLEDLRSRIRHALLTDKLGPLSGPRMTATEVLERSAEMAMILGATYGRLQSELMTPLIQRSFAILRRRGEVPDINIDGRLVELDHRSPLARAQGQRDIQNTLFWVEAAMAMGGAAAEAINLPAAARFLGESLGVPSDLIRKEAPPAVLPDNNKTMERTNEPDQRPAG